MPDITELVDTSDLRIHIARNGTVPDHDAGVVLLWVQRAQRASGNHAANVAIDLANKLQIPVVALFCLVPAYPSATLRAYHFMAEGLAELEKEFSARNVGWALKVGHPAEVIPEKARASGARALVTDMAPTRDARAWKQAVASAVDIPMVLVDADVVIPTAHFTKLEWAPRTIRPQDPPAP